MGAKDDLDRSSLEAFCRSVAQKAATSVGCTFRDVLRRHKSRAYLLARLRKEFPKETDEKIREVIDGLRRETRDAAAGEPAPDDLEPEQEWNPHEPQRGREARAAGVWPYRIRQLEAALAEPHDMAGVLELAKSKLGWERNWTIQVITAGEDAGVFAFAEPFWMRATMKQTIVATGVLGLTINPGGVSLCVLRGDWVDGGADWLRVETTRFEAPVEKNQSPRERIERLHRLAWRSCDYAAAKRVEHVFIESYTGVRRLEEIAELGGVLRRDFALRLGKWAETAPAAQARRLVLGVAPTPAKDDPNVAAREALRKLGAMFTTEETQAWLVANWGLRRLGFRAVSAAPAPSKAARK